MRSYFRLRDYFAVLVCLTVLGMGWSSSAFAESELAKLLASDGAADDRFGQSAAIWGDYAIVGACLDDDNGEDSGSAYIFRFNGSSWIQEQKLTASDAAAIDYFGISVGIRGDTVIIGARGNDDNGDWSGSAYIFRFNGSSWVEEAKLTASDGEAYDGFGCSVAVWGNTAIIGARYDNDTDSEAGSAYIFRFNGSSWVEEAKLLASNGTQDANFGTSVGIQGDTVIIGATYHDDGRGAAYIFRFNGSSWAEEDILFPSDSSVSDYFGGSVAISGDIAVIGASADDDKGNRSGSAYVFRFNGSYWGEADKLTASDGAEWDAFGISVGIWGDTAIIGASRDGDNGDDSGSAYIFRFDGASWVEQAKLLASDGAEKDFFGTSIGISGDVAIIGAASNDDNGSNSGSSYIFDISVTSYYVDADAPAGGDGGSWETAFNYLQDGLAVAQSVDEIWVAQGTYTPDSNSANPGGTGDRQATFQLKNAVAVKGGYAGYGEPDPNARDIELYETVLSGDLAGNDIQVDPCDLLDEPTRAENSYHVVTGSYTDKTAVLDGFTITAGNAEGGSPPRCFGGGMFNESANPIVSNCTFCSNFSHNGGGMYNKSSNTMLTECIFSGNSAGDGGGMLNDESYLTLVNCIFSGNSATICAGGMYDSNSGTTLINCTFSNNYSISWGGGIHGAFSEPTLINCILWDNTADRGSQISMKYSSIVSVSYCDVEGGQAAIYLYNSTVDWGNGNIDDDPLFMDPNGADNILGTKDDNLRLLPDSPCIDAGDPCYVPEPNETDLDGNPRIINGRIDMGAYESDYIKARLRLLPRTINRQSKMKRVMAWMQLPEGITKDQIDQDTPLLLYPGPLEPINQYIFEHSQKGRKRTNIFILYDKAELMAAVTDNGLVDVQVIGSLNTGQYFYGNGFITIIDRQQPHQWRLLKKK